MNNAVGQELHFEHKLPVMHLLEELNVLRDKLKPAFANTIQWFIDDALFQQPSQITLVEIVPRRMMGHKHVKLATFTRETLFRPGVLTVHDPRVSEHFDESDPSALFDCVQDMRKRCCSQKEIRVEIAAVQ